MTLKEIYNYIKNNKDRGQLENAELGKCVKSYFQISLIDNNEPYSLSKIHFEIRDKYRLDIHFEENDTTRYKQNKQLQKLVEISDFEWFKWFAHKDKNPNNKSLKTKNKNITNQEELEIFLKFIEQEHKRFNDILIKIAKESSNIKKDTSIKNIILYGSPGVGKTHNTNKLIRLIEDAKSDRKIFDTIKANENSESIDIDDIKDRVKFVTFHQSFGYEDFIEGFKPNEEGNIELVDGVFKNICTIAQKNLDDSVKEKGLDIESLLNDFTRYIEEQEDFEIDENITIKVKKKSNGELQSFVTKGRVKNQNLTRDIIIRDLQDYLDGEITDYKDIKPTYESKSSYHGNAPYYYKLYAKIKNFSNDKEAYQVEKVEQQNYYLVIDEINRGNISKIFGELITLLEEDKRDKLEVTLPYSKKPFKIPSNLYIIGTMNSTDKSIALIDIALRRRFTFLKMKPNAELIEYDKAKGLFIELNKYIKNSHLGEDYQIGHSYFMGIKDHDDLNFVWEYKIKPLLEEYFYGDNDNLQEILKIKI